MFICSRENILLVYLNVFGSQICNARGADDRMNRIWKTILGVLCVVLIVVLIAVFGDGVQNFSARYEGYDLTADVTGLGRSNTYDGYLQAHASAPLGISEVAVDIAVFEGV